MCVMALSKYQIKGVKFCPETASQNWEYYGNINGAGGWIEDTDAQLRCSDCANFPDADECGKHNVFLLFLFFWVI